jgi:hypothetical protein
MIFLIDYDRREGQLISIREFQDSERGVAESARLELELTLHQQDVDREVVLLQADSVEALRRTHRRYFVEVRQLISELQSSTSAAVVRERRE